MMLLTTRSDAAAALGAAAIIAVCRGPSILLNGTSGGRPERIVGGAEAFSEAGGFAGNGVPSDGFAACLNDGLENWFAPIPGTSGAPARVASTGAACTTGSGCFETRASFNDEAAFTADFETVGNGLMVTGAPRRGRLTGDVFGRATAVEVFFACAGVIGT
jgi:hypothetical protein